MNISNQAVIHKRLKCFVNYIATEKDTLDEIKIKAGEIRECIESRAERDGYTVLHSPYSGSFAVRTGLRRSLRGTDEVEGQDVDIAFVLKDEDSDGNTLNCMIDTFEGYLKERWPASEIGKSKSAANIHFKGMKQQFDVVPLIETKTPNIQKLIRTTGEERQSSVFKHKEFLKGRNVESDKIAGVVHFNQCIRLIKWWRYKQQSDSTILGKGDGKTEVPSFLLNLLCAYAYDSCSVKPTYAETLARWFSFLYDIVYRKESIVFTDFIKRPKVDQNKLWSVLDPVDDTNNVVKNWGALEINELTDWLEDARDKMTQAIRYDQEGEDQKSLECLIELFGNSISNQCKDA
jgi:hypothetical protein